MTELQIEIIGLTAACLTTGSFLPQVYKIWKHKISNGVSLSMYLFMFMGVVLWFFYGLLIGSVSVMLANLLAALLQLIIIYFKLKLKKK
jgi:MtN3 and saliva related transmembrane protein